MSWCGGEGERGERGRVHGREEERWRKAGEREEKGGKVRQVE